VGKEGITRNSTWLDDEPHRFAAGFSAMRMEANAKQKGDGREVSDSRPSDHMKCINFGKRAHHMARRTIARPPTPVLPDAPTLTDGPSASDLLENKLAQLKSLLWCCHGEGIDWSGGPAPGHLENVIWIAAEMVDAAVELHQQCASAYLLRT
jgi:hypothetical protein